MYYRDRGRDDDGVGAGCLIFVIAPALLIVALLWWIIRWLDDRIFDGNPVIARTVGYSMLIIMVGTVLWVLLGGTGAERMARLDLIGEILFVVFILPWLGIFKFTEWFSS